MALVVFRRMGLLSFAKARTIRRDYARGWTQVALANRFDVSRRTVRSVLTGRSWREDGAS